MEIQLWANGCRHWPMTGIWMEYGYQSICEPDERFPSHVGASCRLQALIDVEVDQKRAPQGRKSQIEIYDWG